MTNTSNRKYGGRQEFPLFAGHIAVVCFNCSNPLNGYKELRSDLPKGQWFKTCPKCQMNTFYDVQEPATMARCGYVCHFNGKRWETTANTLLEARVAAIEHFKVRKSQRGLLSVMLAEKDGKPVVHRAVD